MFFHNPCEPMGGRFSHQTSPTAIIIHGAVVVFVFVCMLVSLLLFWSVFPSACVMEFVVTKHGPNCIVCDDLYSHFQWFSDSRPFQKLGTMMLMLFLFRKLGPSRSWCRCSISLCLRRQIVNSASFCLQLPRRVIRSHKPHFLLSRVLMELSRALGVIYVHVCFVFMKLVHEIDQICNYSCIARTGIS